MLSKIIKYIVSITIILLIASSVYVYINYYRPVQLADKIVKQLESHFVGNGINVTPRYIDHSSEDLDAAVEFEFRNRPIGISILIAKNEKVAQSHFHEIKRSPNLDFPQINGRLIMILSYWENSKFTQKVIKSFNEFRNNT